MTARRIAPTTALTAALGFGALAAPVSAQPPDDAAAPAGGFPDRARNPFVLEQRLDGLGRGRILGLRLLVGPLALAVARAPARGRAEPLGGPLGLEHLAAAATGAARLC